MSGGYVQADLTELENFVKHLHTASVEFKKDMAAFLDGVGFDMLQIIPGANFTTPPVYQPQPNC